MARFIPLTIATALAAKLTKRPVRCHLTRCFFFILCVLYFLQIMCARDQDIRIMGQRGEFRGEYRLGVTAGELKNKRCASNQKRRKSY